MIRQSLPVMSLLLLFGPLSDWTRAQSIPTAIPYTGSVTVEGIPFNGNGQFKFAIVTQNGSTTLWSNDGTSSAGSEPANSVTVAVSNGLYALELGNPDRANMQTILPAAFNNPTSFLRVWFSDGVNGFQLLSPDRQLVSVPYAYQSERAHEVSGTGTVVKSIGLAGTPGTPLRDDVVFEGAGNVDVQQIGNTIRVVGTTGTAAAVDLACATPCVSSAEISGTLTDAQIPATIARDSEVTTAVSSAIAAHSSANGAHTLSTLAGSVTDAQIPANIARDSEVTAGVANAIANHITANDAHPLSSFTTGTLAEARIDALIARDAEVAGAITAHAGAANAHALSSFTTGTLAEARIDAAITRDSEVPGLVGTAVATAIGAHAAANDAHALSSFTTGTLAEARIDAAITRDSEVPGLVGTAVATAIGAHAAANDAHALSSFTTGTLAEARIDAAITRDSEVPGLVGTAVATAIGAHAAANDAHALSSFTTGTLAEARIDDAIARDAELTWTNLAGKPAGFADDIDNTGTLIATNVINTVSAATGVTTQSASCGAGTTVVGGGFDHDDETGLVTLSGSWPSSSTVWSVKVNNGTAGAVAVRVYAVCGVVS